MAQGRLTLTTSMLAGISAEALVWRRAWNITAAARDADVLPTTGHVVRQQRLALVIAKHQGVRLRLAQAQLHADLQLLAPVVAQHLDGMRRQGNRAPAIVGLGLLEDQARLGLFQRPLNAQRRRVKIDAIQSLVRGAHPGAARWPSRGRRLNTSSALPACAVPSEPARRLRSPPLRRQLAAG